MKSCPSSRKLVLAVAAGEVDESVREHLSRCPACAALAEEEHRLDAFFRTNHRPAAPPDFLWTRIASRLESEPVAAPWWRRLVLQPLPAVLLLVLVLVSGLLLVPEFGHRTATVRTLASIEWEYQRIINTLQSTNQNPFDGRQLFETARDENPFHVQSSVQGLDSSGENPFKNVRTN